MAARRMVPWMAMPLASVPVMGEGSRDKGDELAPVSISMAHGMGGLPIASDELL